MRAFFLGLVVLLAVHCVSAQAQSETRKQAQPDNVETFLRSQMQKRKIPGLQVAVVQHGKIVFLGAYGLANIEHSVKVSNNIVFPINSATKSFTGVAIMQLVEEGKLSLEAPISRYLDELPAAWQSITIRQLLSHTSGIPNILDQAEKWVGDGDEDAGWANIQKMPMEFAPGERFNYNQTNYFLLGRIIRKLSGSPFTEFITTRQFRVARMPRTTQAGFVDSYDVVLDGAQPYTYFPVPGRAAPHEDTLRHAFDDLPPFIRTAAGINSTAEEMARWIIALQQGKLLKAKTSLMALWTPVVLNNGSLGGFGGLLNGYALGWPTISRPKHRAVGGIGGARVAFCIYPDDDLAVVILTNLQGSQPQELLDEVAGYYIPALSGGFSPSIQALRTELMKRGFDHALEVAKEAKAKDSKFHLAEGDLNMWGYRLMEQGQAKEAVQILELNVSLYPESANTYDSLGAAYENIGDRVLAIKNYKRSLELNPNNNNAAKHIKALESVDTSPH
jgi:CubicO group peptidase (beta-lactamase class C family)